MSRPREFDPEEVLDHAMHVFWRNGYELSSLDDICAAAGVSRSTLYATFGDKRELLRLTLARYTRNSVTQLGELLAPPQPIRTAIASILAMLVDRIVAGPGRAGCFIGNCAAELARHDRAALADVTDGLRCIESILYEALDRAKARGELAPNTDITALSRYFMASFQGLRLVGKANPDRGVLEDIASTIVRVLD
jgi:TetR/AcrR family transcriptional repressor of nem operon